MAHSGRPVLRQNSTHVLVLCPLGHLIRGMPVAQWAGSLLEAMASDPSWSVECDGAAR